MKNFRSIFGLFALFIMLSICSCSSDSDYAPKPDLALGQSEITTDTQVTSTAKHMVTEDLILVQAKNAYVAEYGVTPPTQKIYCHTPYAAAGGWACVSTASGQIYQVNWQDFTDWTGTLVTNWWTQANHMCNCNI